MVIGYFDILKKKINFKRLVHLVLAVWFYSWAGLLVGLMAGIRPSLNQLLMCALPFTTEHYWFIDVYLILSLLTPFINKAIADIDRKGYKGILLVGLIGFSVLPSFMPFASEIFFLNGGANIVWFVILYLIGGYLRIYNPFERVPGKILAIGFVAFSFVTFIVKLAAQAAVAILFSGEHIGGGLLYHHNSITVIAAAVLLFVMMQRLNLSDTVGRKTSAVAGCTFGVYLGHEHELFRMSFWQGLVLYLPSSPSFWTFAMSGLILCVFSLFLAIEAARKKLLTVLRIDEMGNRIANYFERRIQTI